MSRALVKCTGPGLSDLAHRLSVLPSPDVAHLHDWQSGFAAAYMAQAERRPRIVATIHNIAFQGWFPAQLLSRLGLPPQAMSIEGVEYYGGIGFLKAGIYYADRITTVSPSYASEILEPAGGMGLEGLLRSRKRDLFGILNGIDVEVWDPATDAALEMRYSAKDLSGRRLNKRALSERFRLAASAGPTFGVVSRLSAQKGLDLLADAIPALLETGANLAVLGAGDAGLEDRFRALAETHQGRVGCAFGYDETLAHLIQGGADALLVPSRFEPCGLTQLCALRYGAVPVVARVGGLADTVWDASPKCSFGTMVRPPT
ncbi:glycogen synthase [Hansschlegelia beijingensis]